MTKQSKIITITTAGAVLLAVIYAAIATFTQVFTPAAPNGIGLEVNNATYDKITVVDGAWLVHANGYSNSTHYARLRVKLPEQFKLAPSSFYMRSVIVLPADFYTKQNSGFRVMNTDNFTTTLNGVQVGARDANEMRCGVWFWTDHLLRVRCEHETVDGVTWYQATSQLATGEHVIEYWGDMAAVAPWGFRIDGVMIASGNAMLSTSSTVASERVITRMVTGIDGAWQNSTAFELTVKSFTISDAPPDSATPTPITFTATQTATFTPTITRTPTSTPTNTFTPTATPAIISTPTFECLLFTAHNVRVCLP
jgi:hypothetical protein